MRIILPAFLIFLCAAVPAALKASDRVVVIDPGHGGKDKGSLVGGKKEKELVLEIALRLKRHLSKIDGVVPVLTREDDEFIALTDRVFKAEEVKGKVFLSLHMDSSWRGKARGVIPFVYGTNKKIPRGPEREPGEELIPPPPKNQVIHSKKLAEFIRLSIKAENIQTVDYVDKGSFAVLKSWSVPSVLIELGNLRNKGERFRLTDADSQERLARALAGGIKKYLAEEKSHAVR